MPAYNVFFFGALFFLVGVLLASAGLKPLLVLLVALLAGAIFLFWGVFSTKKKLIWLAGLSLLMIVGAAYFYFDNANFQKINIPFESKINFSGRVINDPEIKLSSQELKVELSAPLKGNVLVKLPLYSRFNYGDLINFEGVIKKPSPTSYAQYLAKERISGISDFPKTKLIAGNRGSVFKTKLFQLKNYLTETFQKILPSEEAAFLSGLTIGERGEFSSEFKNAMAKSGTTHLVALSGYNITIIAWTIAGIFLYFFSRRTTFFLTTILIIGFVLMTGAEASVVRAAIMGILVLLAKEVGRLFDFRNAVILAALIMVLFNPKILAFDAGFQLSFLALLGIVYLRPTVIKFLKISEEPGFLSWRDNLLTTLSAQLAVAPILISNFGNFSLTSLLANVIILETVPVVMGLGFIIAAASLVSFYLSLILGWVVWVLLKFQILVIELFSKLSIPFSTSLGIVLIVLYYSLLLIFIAYYERRDIKMVRAA